MGVDEQTTIWWQTCRSGREPCHSGVPHKYATKLVSKPITASYWSRQSDLSALTMPPIGQNNLIYPHWHYLLLVWKTARYEVCERRRESTCCNIIHQNRLRRQCGVLQHVKDSDAYEYVRDENLERQQGVKPRRRLRASPYVS